MFEYLTNKLFVLEDDVFKEKIQKIESNLQKSPEGITTKNLEAFKNIIQFSKNLRKLENLNAFFISNQGNWQFIG